MPPTTPSSSRVPPAGGGLELADIIDAPQLQDLMDDFHKVCPVPMFVVDRKGAVLAGVGWADICTRFHRVQPEACKKCVESDTEYSSGVPEGQYRIYKCKNGMWSVATPLICGGEHYGNLFTGQFFFMGEEPDREAFRAQAQRYGFAEREYLEALDRAPRLSRRLVEDAMQLYLKLARDLARRGWTHIQLSRVNRVLTARSRSVQAVLRAAEEQALLDEVCKIIVEDCGYAMTWIGLAGQDAGKTVRPAAFAGCEKEALDGLEVTWADAKRGRGPTGTAIRTGKPVICRDIRSDPMVRPWRAKALERGYASSAVLPLRADGKAFGAVAIYSAQPGAFTDSEVSLLSDLSGDLVFGIGALRMRAARKAAEARFIQAQKMEAVGLLAGGIAHDFNNILATIVGYNSLLLAELKDDELREFSLEIKHSSEMAAKLTQQLLGVSGNRGAQRRVLDANSVIMAMAKMLRRLLGEKIRLDLKLDRSAWPLKMDSGQLEQIVLNLSVNARDAMPKGGRLTLATKNVLVKRKNGPKAGEAPPPGRCVMLEVRDNGIGMDAEVQARLFEPFFTTKGPGRGTGLGLSTVNAIAEEYGGYIEVRSKPGRGSAFRIFLPSVIGAAKGAAAGGKIKKSQRGHEAVLIVEDNAGLITVLELALRRAGYAVFSARTAEEAMTRCGRIKGNIDLLLADVVLPDMDGPDLAKRLKSMRPGMRTVYMSGYPGNTLGPVTGIGGCVLLEKPFSPDQMLNTVREVLDLAQGDLF